MKRVALKTIQQAHILEWVLEVVAHQQRYLSLLYNVMEYEEFKKQKEAYFAKLAAMQPTTKVVSTPLAITANRTPRPQAMRKPCNCGKGNS